MAASSTLAADSGPQWLCGITPPTNAAKGGVHGLTTGMAREFAKDGITVNTVGPLLQ
jgi:NAD(P)-dependent dehydrogenase (short-subunit alcohol dehydrogenase family)